MKRIDKKILIILSSLLFVITVLVSIGFSYAVWFDEQTQVDPNTLGSGCLEITFTEDVSSNITLEKAFPISDLDGMNLVPYTFTVENTCTLDANYQINLEVLNSSTLDASLIKGVIDNDVPAVMSIKDTASATLEDATSYVMKTLRLEVGETRSHSFRMWIDESGIKDNSMNKNVTAKIVILAVPAKSNMEICIDNYDAQGLVPNPDNNFTYTETSGEVSITDSSATGDLVIPCEIDNIVVTEIKATAFSSSNLTSVKIPETVEVIGDAAFANNQLTSVTIPEIVEVIGSSAFSSNQLTNVNIPDGIITLDSGVFQTNKLTSITIPDSVKYINSDAFAHNNIELLNIPENVVSIGNSAFTNNKITSIIIPDNVIEIGINVFYSNLLTSVEIGTGITEIPLNAFGLNFNLSSVSIGNNVETIGQYAFNQAAISSLIIPDSVVNIESQAFYLIPELKNVTLGENLQVIGTSAFAYCGLTSLVIPNNVLTIGSASFRSNKITTLNLGTSVEHIMGTAFLGNLLSNVTIPSSVHTIEGHVFSDMYNLTLNVRGKSSESDFTRADSYWMGNRGTIVNYLG